MGIKEREMTRGIVKESPVMCGDFEMKELKEEKWLGDYLAEGLKESIKLTIKKREAKIRRAGFQIVNLIKDYHCAQSIGGFSLRWCCGRAAQSPPSSTTARPGWRSARRRSRP